MLGMKNVKNKIKIAKRKLQLHTLASVCIVSILVSRSKGKTIICVNIVTLIVKQKFEYTNSKLNIYLTTKERVSMANSWKIKIIPISTAIQKKLNKYINL